MWNKFVFWMALAGATCTLRANIGIILRTLGGEEFVTGLIAECARRRTGRACTDRPATCPPAASCLTESGSVLEASMLRDIERGNPTEAEYTLGDLVERARTSASTPIACAWLYTHMQAYEICRQSI